MHLNSRSGERLRGKWSSLRDAVHVHTPHLTPPSLPLSTMCSGESLDWEILTAPYVLGVEHEERQGPLPLLQQKVSFGKGVDPAHLKGL